MKESVANRVLDVYLALASSTTEQVQSKLAMICITERACWAPLWWFQLQSICVEVVFRHNISLDYHLSYTKACSPLNAVHFLLLHIYPCMSLYIPMYAVLKLPTCVLFIWANQSPSLAAWMGYRFWGMINKILCANWLFTFRWYICVF